MNRCLHWNDMRWFKREGIPTYDLGGWYNGIQDEEKLRINKFKEEFGGTIVKNYNCVQGVTLKGKVALLINRHFRKR
jgi:lipid II:glycine glycyltransferase (peptidoglycan interpeptide bridge formation enzyme)